jgi:hypothetical protein
MKPRFLFLSKASMALALALAGVLMTATPSDARDKDRGKDKHRDNRSRFHSPSRHFQHHKHRHDDHDRRTYFSRPSSTFVLSFGTGYAGRGYYYGPPGAAYHYQAPGVRYYATRPAVPSHYSGTTTVVYADTGASVQRELARRGYYRGAIDGSIGPASRSAIARYQADSGLSVTGSITPSLLRSLGL